MKKQQFKTTINAPRNIVWHALWQIDNYRKWTSAFAEGSNAFSNWKEGDEIVFGDGKGNGMYSVIEKREELSYMAFKHLGEIKDGQKQPESSWAGSLETYTLTENGSGTDLLVEIDLDDAWLDYFLKTWPVALEKLKAIAESPEIKRVTIETLVKAPAEKVWQLWTEPQHIMQWNNASDDWHTPSAINDLKPGGNFVFTMAARDGSFSFDFGGTYDAVKDKELIAYTIADGRKVQVSFSPDENGTAVKEVFEVESMNPIEMQRSGWQAILNNFKKHVEEI
jgi:uncharacterized protein YndB with AHSA1/START domain